MIESTILVLDSNRTNLETMKQQLAEEGFATVGVSSLEELASTLYGEGKFVLALIDVTGFDKDIWQHCTFMHESKIPFIIISPQRSPRIQRESLKSGASGLLVKPLGFKDLMEHIHTALGD